MHKAYCNVEEAPYNFSIWVRLLGWSQLSNPSDLPCYCFMRMQWPLNVSFMESIKPFIATPSSKWLSLLNIWPQMKTHLAVQALVFIVVRGSAIFLWHDQFIRKITVNSLQLSCPRARYALCVYCSLLCKLNYNATTISKFYLSVRFCSYHRNEKLHFPSFYSFLCGVSLFHGMSKPSAMPCSRYHNVGYSLNHNTWLLSFKHLWASGSMLAPAPW